MDDCDEIPHQKMNENYKLLISNDGIRLIAATEWGILHGLETLGLASLGRFPRFRRDLSIFNFRLTSGETILSTGYYSVSTKRSISSAY